MNINLTLYLAADAVSHDALYVGFHTDQPTGGPSIWSELSYAAVALRRATFDGVNGLELAPLGLRFVAAATPVVERLANNVTPDATLLRRHVFAIIRELTSETETEGVKAA